MKRGDIFIVAGRPDYAGKPPKVVVVHDDRLDATGSIKICAFTTDPVEAPLLRLAVNLVAENGLRAGSRLMVDKITTVAKSKIGPRIGRLSDKDVVRLNQAMMVFLGLAG